MWLQLLTVNRRYSSAKWLSAPWTRALSNSEGWVLCNINEYLFPSLIFTWMLNTTQIYILIYHNKSTAVLIGITTTELYFQWVPRRPSTPNVNVFVSKCDRYWRVHEVNRDIPSSEDICQIQLKSVNLNVITFCIIKWKLIQFKPFNSSIQIHIYMWKCLKGVQVCLSIYLYFFHVKVNTVAQRAVFSPEEASPTEAEYYQTHSWKQMSGPKASSWSTGTLTLSLRPS